MFASVWSRLLPVRMQTWMIARMTIRRTAASLPPARTPSTTAWSSCPASQTCAAGRALCTIVISRHRQREAAMGLPDELQDARHADQRGARVASRLAHDRPQARSLPVLVVAIIVVRWRATPHCAALFAPVGHEARAPACPVPPVRTGATIHPLI